MNPYTICALIFINVIIYYCFHLYKKHLIKQVDLLIKEIKEASVVLSIRGEFPYILRDLDILKYVEIILEKINLGLGKSQKIIIEESDGHLFIFIPIEASDKVTQAWVDNFILDNWKQLPYKIKTNISLGTEYV